tara:strand:+ start:513 stop:944 length:432 start_codon:yes stop_codon:yes gene_type:complete
MQSFKPAMITLLMALSSVACSEPANSQSSSTAVTPNADLSVTLQPPQQPLQMPIVLAANDSPAKTTNAIETTTEKATTTSKININTANVAELTRMTGIGAAKAEAIVRYRQENGPFATVEDLAQVRGIGSATIEKNRWLVTTK